MNSSTSLFPSPFMLAPEHSWIPTTNSPLCQVLTPKENFSKLPPIDSDQLAFKTNPVWSFGTRMLYQGTMVKVFIQFNTPNRITTTFSAILHATFLNYTFIIPFYITPIMINLTPGPLYLGFLLEPSSLSLDSSLQARQCLHFFTNPFTFPLLGYPFTYSLSLLFHKLLAWHPNFLPSTLQTLSAGAVYFYHLKDQKQYISRSNAALIDTPLFYPSFLFDGAAYPYWNPSSPIPYTALYVNLGIFTQTLVHPDIINYWLNFFSPSSVLSWPRHTVYDLNVDRNNGPRSPLITMSELNHIFSLGKWSNHNFSSYCHDYYSVGDDFLSRSKFFSPSPTTSTSSSTSSSPPPIWESNPLPQFFFSQSQDS